MAELIHFHERIETDDCPAGLTVSRSSVLPEGDFTINEYSWDDLTLWFVEDDAFTADERQAAYYAAMNQYLGS